MEVGLENLNSYNDVREFLFGLRNTGMKYGIERMQRLAEALSHPERSYPVIHVAGTNGKGSTCAAIESIYRSAGYKTGLYTSPHLVRLNERIQVNRRPIADETVVEMTRQLANIGSTLEAEEIGLFPSFFEFMTGMAFLHFQKEAVDVAIIEVGLGGRLDATNVVKPSVTAITSIALDHTHILGDTLEEIAAEKAGIVKSCIPVVLGNIQDGPQAVIKGIAQERNSPVIETCQTDLKELPETNLAGTYQRYNAAVAKGCVELLNERLPISLSQIEAGLKTIDWSGRWETLKLSNGQRLILDSTHNIEGMTGLSENLSNLRNEYSENTRFPIIAGVLGRDRAENILPILSEYASALYWVVPDQPRASSWESVSDLWASGIPAKTIKIEDLFSPNSVQLERQETPILVTGSIYLIGEVKTYLQQGSQGGDADLQDDLMAKK